MNIKDLEEVRRLSNTMRYQAGVVRSIESLDGPTIPCYARSMAYDIDDVPLMPVTKEVVLSAAKRELSKTVAALQALGVTVDVESLEQERRQGESDLSAMRAACAKSNGDGLLGSAKRVISF